jgi:hypothetical protein
MTEQEHNGLNAPINVARKMAMMGRALKARSIYFEAPDIFTATAIGIVISRYGQVWIKLSNI